MGVRVAVLAFRASPFAPRHILALDALPGGSGVARSPGHAVLAGVLRARMWGGCMTM